MKCVLKNESTWLSNALYVDVADRFRSGSSANWTEVGAVHPREAFLRIARYPGAMRFLISYTWLNHEHAALCRR